MKTLILILRKYAKDIIDDHAKEIGTKHPIDLEDMKLPYMYWLPKHHKQPVGSRFVVSGSHCTMKKLSQDISKALRIIQKSVGFHCTYNHKFSKSSSYWIINNSSSVHENIQNINLNSTAKSVYSGDFSTLYTLIPHNQLISRIKSMVELGYKVSNKQYIRIGRAKASWSTKIPKNPKILYLTADELMECIKLLLDNLYVIFNNTVYQQVIGIPIGSNCSQELANLYLLSYEFDHVNQLIADGNEEARFTEYNSRYIDDLLSLNDLGYIERVYNDIYPVDMKLNKTNILSTSANYLDVHIEIIDGKFITSIYDKRKDFNFKIISLPHMSSNIPSGPAYGVYISQVYRYFRANNNIDGFYTEVKELSRKLVDQGFTVNKLKYHICKFFRKHFLEFTFKYWDKNDVSNCF